MELLEAIKGNLGALAVGAAWMLYVVGDKILRDKQERKQQADTVKGAGSLIEQLNKSLQDAIRLHNAERERADKMADKVSDLGMKVGQLESALKHAEEGKARVEEEVHQLRASVERLVIEARNKDKSIAELVDLNRKILRTMGAAVPAADAAQPEK